VIYPNIYIYLYGDLHVVARPLARHEGSRINEHAYVCTTTHARRGAPSAERQPTILLTTHHLLPTTYQLSPKFEYLGTHQRYHHTPRPDTSSAHPPACYRQLHHRYLRPPTAPCHSCAATACGRPAPPWRSRSGRELAAAAPAPERRPTAHTIPPACQKAHRSYMTQRTGLCVYSHPSLSEDTPCARSEEVGI
jgi:hypothetical protein